jgi:hypothetical protein
VIGTRERTVIAATCNLAVAALLSMPLACASTGATWNTPGLHAPDRIGHVIDSVVTSPQLAAT